MTRDESPVSPVGPAGPVHGGEDEHREKGMELHGGRKVGSLGYLSRRTDGMDRGCRVKEEDQGVSISDGRPGHCHV